MKKKTIILFVFLIFLIVCLKKFGILDSNIVKIDYFYIKKPFLYRNFNNANIKLSDYDNIKIYFFKYDGSLLINYFIKKITDKDKYKYVLNVEKPKIKNIYSCNIFRKKNFKMNIEKVHIYKYPYIISFYELNRERELKIINQICNNEAHIIGEENIY